MTGDAIPELFTLKEVAERTGFSLRTLQDDCRAGRVAHVHRGRDRLMTADQVRALIDQHTTAAAVTAPAAPAVDERAAYREANLRRVSRKLARAGGSH